jgi:lipid A 3-O-deacylase
VSGACGALLVAAVLCTAAAHAQVDDKKRGSEIQIYIENDMLSGTDRYYTNGIKIGFGVPLGGLADLLQVPAASVLREIADTSQVHVGLFFGQNLYTPRRITEALPQPLDRPWAAWLYVAGVAQLVDKNPRGYSRLRTVELDVGAVGPAAFGREVQTDWHRIVGVDQPRGWSNQIPNEPGFLLAYLQKERVSLVDGVIDAVPHFGATVGNVMTLARAGGIVRFGQRMTGFGPDSIEPGGAMLQNTRYQDSGVSRSGSEWYGFIGTDLRAVGYNIFLDGTLFSDSPSVDRRPFVYDVTVGFSARVQALRFSLTHVRRSSEFDTALGSSGKQQFQSLNMGWEW